MELIGHRGCAEQVPENTLRGIRTAARRLPAVEIDVRRCGSGELIAFHDERLDRVTDSDGLVAETSWADLSELTVLDSSEPIARLKSVLGAVPAGVTVQLELKERDIAAETVQLAMAAGVDLRVSSFLPDALAELNAAPVDVPNGLLFGEKPDRNLSRAIDLGCTHVFPHFDLCIDTDIVPTAREHGFDIIAWKAARTVEDVRALYEAGVDGVTADRWDIVPESLSLSGDRQPTQQPRPSSEHSAF